VLILFVADYYARRSGSLRSRVRRFLIVANYYASALGIFILRRICVLVAVDQSAFLAERFLRVGGIGSISLPVVCKTRDIKYYHEAIRE